MALIKCKECKAEISNSAKVCPQCGAKQPKNASFIGIVMVLLLGAGFYSLLSKTEEAKTQAASPAAAAASPNTATAATPVSWNYNSPVDEMTGKTLHNSTLGSSNSLDLKFPYAGENFSELMVRHKAGAADQVLFSIAKGQTMCKSYAADCTVMVRFDDSQPVRFSGQGPSDGSSTTVFLFPASKFIAEAKKAKRIKVSLEIYQNGTQTIDFATTSPLRM